MIRRAAALLALAWVPVLADDVRLAGPAAAGEEGAAPAARFEGALVEALEGCGHRVTGEAELAIEVGVSVEGHRLFALLTLGERSGRAELDRYAHPSPDEVLPLLADLGLALGRGRAAYLERSWTEASVADPEWPWPRLRLAQSLRETGDVEGASRAVAALLERSPGFAPAWNERAIQRYQAGLLDEAVADLERGLALSPDSHDVCQNLSTLLWKRLEYGRALELARRAVEIKPDYHQGWYNLGNCHFVERRLDDAIDAYWRAVELAPAFVQARNMLGKALYDAKRFEESRVVFETVLEVRPDDLESLFHLGVLAQEDPARAGESLAYFRRYLEAGGDDPRVAGWIEQLESAGEGR